MSLSAHDILGEERKLVIRDSKGGKDRFVPLPAAMLEELRAYWRFHRHPRWLFPNAGRGDRDPAALAARMRAAKHPMPYSSLQRPVAVARAELGLPAASVHTLRHSFATHLLGEGIGLRTIQKLLGHKQIESTMVYLHTTFEAERDVRGAMDALCAGLPR